MRRLMAGMGVGCNSGGVGGGAAAGGVLGDKSVWLQIKKKGTKSEKLQRHLGNANMLARRGRGRRQLFHVG